VKISHGRSVLAKCHPMHGEWTTTVQFIIPAEWVLFAAPGEQVPTVKSVLGIVLPCGASSSASAQFAAFHSPPR